MELRWIGLFILVAGFVAILRAAVRARELFVLSVENGATKLARGRVPRELRDALSDVFARAGTRRATVKVLRDGRRARIEASGLDEATLQRARNVLGTFPAHKLTGIS